jgi:hypothetical protein
MDSTATRGGEDHPITADSVRPAASAARPAGGPGDQLAAIRALLAGGAIVVEMARDDQRAGTADACQVTLCDSAGTFYRFASADPLFLEPLMHCVTARLR